ncbi:hypothetical protein DEIPH_ctg026orf0023 [Deinococcus phoenicis]|uniref:Glycosyl transferase family 1 domain-containing protein n=1 Tax=Deinococcus phoenicis TaxID=1476583 RepID=A0A016QQ80_9DEIO|nr:glycosyltransferase family 4 protein [Deinococcus phoenicis]EYB68126.1 hypothetical protein DEIPH_ctg026orf0023 [Deinococcus phoenicis]
MNILYVTSSCPYGAGETFILPELEELRRRGHGLRVVPTLPRGAVLHREAAAVLEFTALAPLFGVQVARDALLETVRAPARVWRAFRLLLTPRPLHLLKNLSVFPKGLWLARYARRWGAQRIHAHWAATSASLALVASEVSGIPWGLTAHRWDIVENNLLTRKAQRAMFTRFISESGLALARARGLSGSAGSVVLHMGTRLPARPPGARPAHAESGLRLLCPANLLPVKGHRYLLEALSLVRGYPVELWLAGQGELASVLRQQARQLGLGPRVRFLGHVPHDELLRLYEGGEVDAVVLPSVDLGGGLHEGIPVALLEGMAYGLPVLSTTTGGIPELLSGGAGLLVPPQDPAALAQAIVALHTRPELRRALGEAGQRRVREEYAIEAVVDRLEQYLQGGTRAAGGRVQPRRPGLQGGQP